MKRRAFVAHVGAGVAGAALAQVSIQELIAAETSKGVAGHQLGPGEIQHMVIFDLKHDKNSDEALKLLRDGKRILTGIPGVKQFQVFTQISPKNDYDFGFSMVFSGQAEYERYNDHPDHVAFVEQRWKKEVSRFLEIDFEAKPV